MIRTDKTVYDKPRPEDGERILVMRTCPRGISKDKVDRWLKELGTDMDLVHEWKQGKVTWSEFSKSYVRSLKGKEGLLKELASRSGKGTVTLLCMDKDEAHCHRSLLRKEIERNP
jgi:uncharacterized protein YeaO (DUF488 family)